MVEGLEGIHNLPVHLERQTICNLAKCFLLKSRTNQRNWLCRLTQPLQNNLQLTSWRGLRFANPVVGKSNHGGVEAVHFKTCALQNDEMDWSNFWRSRLPHRMFLNLLSKPFLEKETLVGHLTISPFSFCSWLFCLISQEISGCLWKNFTHEGTK